MNKQIENMCAIMADAAYADCENTPLVPESAGICDKVDCHRCKEARRLMNAGYRKESDVAREIFEEIGAVCETHLTVLEQIEMITPLIAKGGKHAFDIVLNLLAELKKKYESEVEE